MAKQLKLKNYSFTQLFQADALNQLDQDFLAELKLHQPDLQQDLLDYRNGKNFSPIQISELLLSVSKELEQFIAELFSLEQALDKHIQQHHHYDPIFSFKKWFVTRRAKRRLLRDEALDDFNALDKAISAEIGVISDSKARELQIANYANKLLEDTDTNSEKIEQLTQWCIQAIKTEAGQIATQDWVSFKLPQRKDYQQLIPIKIVDNKDYQHREHAGHLRQRDGFCLTDKRMSLAQILDETQYCVYCHTNNGDFCAKGFPVKKDDLTQGFKKNPLDNLLVGCPLEEKISEMQLLKRDGHTIAALAMIMADNPMCPATGHRICNDCMKACIYQKQDAVNTPQIETRVLTDTLSLPWGVEIYDLLTRWNPLRQSQYLLKPYNGFKVMIAGMGPAGFTLAHHLLMEGFAVLGVDGLKIEPLAQNLIENPIYDFNTIKEDLDERLVTGFGGVTEYGITVRWDKNFLKLIYITLMRRPYFQVFGDTRFGGTISIADAWTLGFDHFVIAVGAGLPKALPIPGSLASGMRQANDFLMALQLTGVAKKDSLSNLQLQLPVLVIGSGLTAVDAATEAQAYYIVQVEKILQRYDNLKKDYSEEDIRQQLGIRSQEILAEFLQHGQAVKQERERANAAGEQADFIKLIRQWGGVSIVYRRAMTESPAYVTNHEELAKAFEEGIFYIEGLQPQEAIIDDQGCVKAMRFKRRHRDQDNVWHDDEQSITLPARSVLVATGAQLNVAYEFEHPGELEREGFKYQGYNFELGHLKAAADIEHVKQTPFGAFTSYQKDGHYVSFIGDTHPGFHGSVVKAIASAKQTYPIITELLLKSNRKKFTDDYHSFAQHIKQQFTAKLIHIQRCTDDVVELTVQAPMAVKKWQPGQFFRLQSFETFAPQLHGKTLQMEALALVGFDASQQHGTITFMIQERGVSSKLCAYLKKDTPISLMGPTGVRSKIPQNQAHILIVGEQLSLAYVRAVAKDLREAGNTVTYLGSFEQAQALYCHEAILNITDRCIWVTPASAQKITPQRQQDFSYNGNIIDALLTFAEQDTEETLQHINRITVIGNSELLRQFRQAQQEKLHAYLKKSPKTFASTYTPMQCMLKGVCAQCLQWQIDPETGLRKKAVFACSWQDQPLEYIDIDNLDQRLEQNNLSEKLNDLWFRQRLKDY
ncbi:MAG: FAD-dependent oxidoreductase [Pseudomonadota bacterium]